MLIPGAVGAVIMAGGALAWLALPEKASVIRVDGDRETSPVSLRIMSLDPDKPFDWVTGAGGPGRGTDDWRLNDYDANRLRILCRDGGDTQVHERSLPAGSSRLVTIRVYGCRAIEVRSSPLPAL